MGQRDGWLGEVGRALNAALRWFGRVVGAGAVAGVLHAINQLIVAFLGNLIGGGEPVTGGLPTAAGYLAFAAFYGALVGAAAGVVAGLLTAPIMASRRLSRRRGARLAVVLGPASLWILIPAWLTRETLFTSRLDSVEAVWTLHFLVLGPAAWTAVGLHFAVRRFDPGLPRRPAWRARADDGDRPLWSWAK